MRRFEQRGGSERERDRPVVVAAPVMVHSKTPGDDSFNRIVQFVNHGPIVWEREFSLTDQLEQRGGDPADARGC